MKNPFKGLTRFEICLWIFSLLAVTVASVLAPEIDIISLISSLIGVTSLIFIARGNVFGHVLMLFFGTFYAVISYSAQYYGEMITYLGMTVPMSLFTIISWLRHPNGDTGEVKVSRLTRKTLVYTLILTLFVTVCFYFILGALGNESLIVSTVSVLTSFFAASLIFLRSPYYALGYALNDIVLIILWIIAASYQTGAYSVVACFSVFLINDLYGFVSWRRMEKRQKAEISTT